MSHDRPPDEFAFAGLTAPDPPAELREKVLAVAREAFSQEAVRDVWTRIWENRSLRLAWAVAASLLVIANVSIGVRRPPGGVVSRTGADAEKEAARELAAVIALPRIDETVQPLAGRALSDASSRHRGPAKPGGGLS